MKIDRGTGLITFSPEADQVGQVFDISIIAENHMIPDIQEFQIIVKLSDDPFAYNSGFRIEFLGIEDDSNWYTGPSKIIKCNIYGPWMYTDIYDISPQSSSNIYPPPPNAHCIFWNEVPKFEVGMMINGEPIGSTQIYDPFVVTTGPNFCSPASYPCLHGFWYNYPTPNTWHVFNDQLRWLDFWEYIHAADPLEHYWSPPGYPDAKYYLDPFGVNYCELLLAAPEVLIEEFGYDWDVDLVFCDKWSMLMERYWDGFTWRNELIEEHYFDPVVVDLCDVEMEMLPRPEEESCFVIGNVTYLDTRTDEMKPLQHARIDLSGMYSHDPSSPVPDHIWTDENGDFDLGFETFYVIDPTWPSNPSGFLRAQNCDPEREQPIVGPAFMFGNEDDPFIVSELYKPDLEQQPLKDTFNYLDFTQSFTAHEVTGDSVGSIGFCNIISDIMDCYLWLREGLAEEEVDTPRQRMRGHYWGPATVPTYYAWMTDRMYIYDDPYGPEYSGSSFDTTIYNYMQGVLQWEFNTRGINNLCYDGGARIFDEAMTDPAKALMWGFGDFATLATYGIENFSYLSEDQEFEYFDHENQTGAPVLNPNNFEGVIASVLLDLYDENYDPEDETNESCEIDLSNIFDSFMKLASNSYYLSTAWSFTLREYCRLWAEEGRDDYSKVKGVFEGHNFEIPDNWPTGSSP